MDRIKSKDSCDEEFFFVPGCLGTCWYGKYHYLEPFTGCEHDCVYCYAKGRNDVINLLETIGTSFEKPEIGHSEETALAKMKKEIDTDRTIHTIKLSRYTDIFSKKFVDNGYSLKVLKLLAEHPQIKRIIITTKGVPNKEISEFIKKHKEKFSYNAVLKPSTKICMEQNAPSESDRLEHASDFARSGVLTTVHMDPLITGFDDTEEALIEFTAKLKTYALKRVMFSYLLYDYGIAKNIVDKFGNNFFAELRKNYKHFDRQLLPSNKETTYFALKPEVKLASIKRISKILKEGDFEFVVCGLKSAESEDIQNIKGHCPVCDGKFYA
jgi:DNA repair photolyase